jgi:predicted ArsR family transcriptional regulator
MCSCAAAALFSRGSEAAQANDAEVDRTKATLDAARVRFAKLIGVLNENLDAETRKNVLQALGRECARQYSGLLSQHKNDLKGFLETGRKQWMERADLDEKAGTLRVVDKLRTCSCPLVKVGETPGEFCDCTLGWQKEAYSAIVGHPVQAELEESILRGGSRCIFRIRIG